MKKTLCLSLGLIAMVFGMSVLAAGDSAAGKQKALVCTACHGADGNSASPVWPKLAGQSERYLLNQLKTFKAGANGARKSPNSAQMYGVMAALSDQDMADLAAYFSTQSIKPGVAQDSLAKQGAAIYRGGNLDSHTPACIACHGPDGKGNAAAGFPAVAGQHAAYSLEQLRAFHSGERTSDANSMMRMVVQQLSNAEMQAVAEYMQGLYSVRNKNNQEK